MNNSDKASLLRENLPSDALEELQPQNEILKDAPVAGLEYGEWRIDADGVYRTVKKGKSFDTIVACSHPIIITDKLEDKETGVVKLRIAFLFHGRWKTVTVDKGALASRTRIVDLANSGVMVTSETARNLIQYLSDLEAMNIERIPLEYCTGRLGFIGGGFIPYMDDIVFDGDADFRSCYNAVTSSGDYEKWIAFALETRDNSLQARVSLAASFASPLVGLLTKLPFIVHLWGDSGGGKTVALHWAASVWGDPLRLVRNLNSTGVGLERLAHFYNNLPLLLDELQTVRGNDFDKMIYSITQGQGRSRGNRGGGVDAITNWRLCSITTGEQPITRDSSGGGAVNRVVDVYCSGPIFHNAPEAASFVQNNYGHAGRRFIDALLAPDMTCVASALFQFYFRSITDEADSTDKQAMSAALLLCADFLANRYIFNLDERDAGKSTEVFKGQLVETLQSSALVDTTARAYQFIRDWVASNPHRFQSDPPGEVWGKHTADGVLIIGSKLNEALTDAGFSYRAVLKGLEKAGYLREGQASEARTHNTKPFKIGRNLVRGVEVILPSHGEADEDVDSLPMDAGVI